MPFVNINGVWKNGIQYTNVNGVWRSGTDYVNVNGVWKQDNPYGKAKYYGPAYSRYQTEGTQVFTNNSDGSYTLSSMGNKYSDSEDYDSGIYRVAFSTPYTLNTGDIIEVGEALNTGMLVRILGSGHLCHILVLDMMSTISTLMVGTAQ